MTDRRRRRALARARARGKLDVPDRPATPPGGSPWSDGPRWAIPLRAAQGRISSPGTMTGARLNGSY